MHKRFFAHSKLANPEVLARWDSFLGSVISQAEENGGRVPDGLINLHRIRAEYGYVALAEIRANFVATRTYNLKLARDLIRQVKTGRISAAEYKALKCTCVYGSEWRRKT